jgi:hypothetical protein
MKRRLLNHNQRRHFATHLQLLLEDLRELAQLPELARDGVVTRGIWSALREAEVAARRLGAALELPVERQRDFRRRVGATADVWAVRTYELEPGALAAYGAVDPDLAPTLAPLVAQLRQRLLELSVAASRPEDS